MSSLTPRARTIPAATIEEFIATGEPVSSRSVAKRAGLEAEPDVLELRFALADELSERLEIAAALEILLAAPPQQQGGRAARPPHPEQHRLRSCRDTIASPRGRRRR